MGLEYTPGFSKIQQLPLTIELATTGHWPLSFVIPSGARFGRSRGICGFPESQNRFSSEGMSQGRPWSCRVPQVSLFETWARTMSRLEARVRKQRHARAPASYQGTTSVVPLVLFFEF
jgi:hypothetical protein